MSLYISESEIPRNDLIKIVETSFHNKFNVPAASSCTKVGNKVSSNKSNTGKADIIGNPLPFIIFACVIIYHLFSYDTGSCVEHRWRTLSVLPG